MPTGRSLLASLSRRRLTTACGVVVPIFLLGAGRWIVWDQFERVEPSATTPLSARATGQAAFAASVTALVAAPAGSAAETPNHNNEQSALMHEALNWVERAQERFATVDDYTCIFTKRERLAPGRNMITQIMEMKVNTHPASVYFRFRQPSDGREAIWVDGQNDNKLLVHEGGLARMLAGTMKVDTRSRAALNENRHPITEAGIGYLVAELAAHWPNEFTPECSQVAIERDLEVEGRTCLVIECIHPAVDPDVLYHRVRVTFDQELALPIRFEAFDWPRDGVSELIEDYTYSQLQLNVGLQPLDFDPANPAYTFGRF